MMIDPENFMVKDQSDSETFTVKEDYELEAEPGIITIIENGSIDNDSTINLTWNTLASTHDRIISGSTSVEGAMRYISRNPAGKQGNFYMPYVKISPNGDYALKGDEWQQLSMNIEVLKIDNETSAIIVDGSAMLES